MSNSVFVHRDGAREEGGFVFAFFQLQRCAEAGGAQQGQRQYYAFPDVDVDRYRLPAEAGGYRQVWLAPREIAPDALDARAQTWPNRHLRYTHGYGLVVSPVNAVSEEGLPEFFVKDIPPRSSDVFPKISRPELVM